MMTEHKAGQAMTEHKAGQAMTEHKSGQAMTEHKSGQAMTEHKSGQAMTEHKSGQAMTEHKSGQAMTEPKFGDVIKLFDTHVHVDSSQYRDDREAVIQRALEAGVDLILNIGYNEATCRRTLDLAARYPFMCASVGIHPHHAAEVTEETYSWLRKMARNPKVVALGEIGLDYYRDLSPRDTQAEVFRRQIALARELRLPVIIHDRDAHRDIVAILKEEKASEVGGVLHCFSGDWVMARECLNLGFHISLAGPVTFPNGLTAQEVAKLAPLDRLLIETDCPYLAPTPHRGKRNEPAHVRLVAEKIAALRRMPLERLAEVTRENGIKLFGLAGLVRADIL